MIDYQEIISQLELDRVKQLLRSLSIPFKETETALIMPTVCHNAEIEKASWKLYYYKDSHIFYCYTDCSEGMSIFKFLKRYYETRNIDYDWYEDILQVILKCSASQLAHTAPDAYKSVRDNYVAQKARKELPTYPKGILDCFVKKYPVEWLNDRISKEAMDLFDIRYSISQNKIIIPHFNVKGELVGIRGRALNAWDIEQFGKYMPVQIENKWYSHPLSLNLYGLDKTWRNIKESGIVFVHEAEKGVLQDVSSVGNSNSCSVACCGSSINKYQVDLLLRTCSPREIVLCFDREEKPGESKYFDKLYKMCQKYRNYCNMSFVYDRECITKLKDSPTDNGKEVFDKLVKGRVRVK